jgi:hypothetical protein
MTTKTPWWWRLYTALSACVVLSVTDRNRVLVQRQRQAGL